MYQKKYVESIKYIDEMEQLQESIPYIFQKLKVISLFKLHQFEEAIELLNLIRRNQADKGIKIKALLLRMKAYQ